MAFTNSLIRSVSRVAKRVSAHDTNSRLHVGLDLIHLQSDLMVRVITGVSCRLIATTGRQLLAPTGPVYSIIVTGSFDDRCQLSRIRACNTVGAPTSISIGRNRDSSEYDSNPRQRPAAKNNCSKVNVSMLRAT